MLLCKLGLDNSDSETVLNGFLASREDDMNMTLMCVNKCVKLKKRLTHCVMERIN